ncbi:HNH endonuclease [Comamonadaceae bacterium PP-2]
MSNEDRFKKNVVAILAKRAANRCSNPDCGAITSGPASSPDGAVNLGEAAHIYGANLGSARFDPQMISADRASIANAIWLCGNCHKLVDDDPLKYPAGLLFEWQRDHEQRISEQVGKAGAEIRQRYERRHLEELGHLSYLAERLVLEKGDYWEYSLTAEVIRQEIAPVIRRWNALKRNLYVKPLENIKREDYSGWFSRKMSELDGIVKAFAAIVNVEFKRAWGEPGVSGVDAEVINISRLFGEACGSALAWEESVRFTHVHDSHKEIRNLTIGVAGFMLDQAEKVPKFLNETINEKPTSGHYRLTIEVKLPDGWVEAVQAAFERAEMY